MTKEELDQIIASEHALGYTDEDIAKKFCLAFIDGKMNRAVFEELMAYVGYYLSDDYKKLSDKKLKKCLLK